jgi:hypothetical protein
MPVRCAVLFLLVGAGLQAQVSFAVYSDSLADLQSARPEVDFTWYVNRQPDPRTRKLAGGQLHVHGPFGLEEVDLKLTGLPPHDSVRVRFLLLNASEQDLKFTCSDGLRWREPESVVFEDTSPDAQKLVFASASEQNVDVVRRSVPHEGPVLRLRWSVADPQDAWSIAGLLVEVQSATKTLDVSGSRARVGQRLAVIFSGTEGVPSHGFLAFEQEQPRLRRTAVTAFGFYPDPEISYSRIAMMWSVPGQVLDEFQTRQWSRTRKRLVVYVNPAQFRAAQAIVARWRCRGRYRLLTQDCVEMVREVAVALGLEVPPRGLLGTRPADYIAGLVDAN